MAAALAVGLGFFFVLHPVSVYRRYTAGVLT